jgi:hypothetical protein
MIFSDLPSPAEASNHWDGLRQGFAQAGNRRPLFMPAKKGQAPPDLRYFNKLQK